MHRFQNILVGVDLSHGDRIASPELNPPTREAVRQAIWLASQQGASLTFFAAVDVSAHTQELLDQMSHSIENDAGEVLAGLVSQAAEAGVRADSHLAFGRAWYQIIQQVLRSQHDLVIVGTRHHIGSGRLLFGSTGTKLLRKCPCPVWITKPDPNQDGFNILVATDLSGVGQLALEVAVGAGQLAGGRLMVLHVLEREFDHSMQNIGTSSEDLQAFYDRKRAEAEQTLHKQLAETDYRTIEGGVKVEVREGSPELMILETIEEHQIDLLVMGTVARSGLSGVLLGNTAERLFSQIPCSLLAVKPEGFVSPVVLDEPDA